MMMKPITVTTLTLLLAVASAVRVQNHMETEHKFELGDIASGVGDFVKNLVSTPEQIDKNPKDLTSFMQGMKFLAVEAGKKAGKATVLAAVRPMALAMFEKQVADEKELPPEKRTLPSDITVEMFDEALNEFLDTNAEAMVRSRGEEAPGNMVDNMFKIKDLDEKLDSAINELSIMDVAKLPTAVDIMSKHLAGKDINEVDLSKAYDTYEQELESEAKGPFELKPKKHFVADEKQ